MKSLFILLVAILFSSCQTTTWDLETTLIKEEVFLVHNDWPTGHGNRISLNFKKNRIVEYDKIPGFDSKVWEVISTDTFRIGKHVFRWDRKRKSFYSPFNKAEMLNDNHRRGYHIILPDLENLAYDKRPVFYY